MRRTTLRNALMLTFLFLVNPSQGQNTYDWISGSGSWDNANAWTGGPSVPGVNDTARFSAGGTYTISDSGTRSVGAIDWMDIGAGLRIVSSSIVSSAFTVGNDFTINGTLEISSNDNVSSTLTRSGSITNAASGTINMIGSSTNSARALRADSFVNNGTVNVNAPSEFDKTSGVFNNNANVNVASGASLIFGSANTFNQDGGTFDNQGSFEFSADTLNFNGGNFTGNPVKLTTSTLNNNTTGTGTFQLFGVNTYSGDLDPNQFLDLISNSTISQATTIESDFTNRSTINIISNDNVSSTLTRSGSITNAASGTINMIGSSTNSARALRADSFVNNGTVNVNEPSEFDKTSGVFNNNANVNVASGASLIFGSANTFNQDGGTFDNQGSFEFSADTLNFNGGNFTGNPVKLTTSTLNNNTTGTGTFQLFGVNTYSGDLDPNQFLDLISNSTISQATTIESDFTNRSTINIISNDNVSSTLTRSGSITNAASGTINMIGSSTNSARALRADSFVNNGTVNVNAPSEFDKTSGVFNNNANVNVASGASLIFGSANTFNQDGGTFDNQGSFEFSADTLNFNGGNFTGNPVKLFSSTLNIGLGSVGSGEFHLMGANSYSGDLAQSQTLRLMATSISSQTTTATSDFTNHSDIYITSSANGVGSTLARDGSITNAATGTIYLGGLDGATTMTLRLDAEMNNQGTIETGTVSDVRIGSGTDVHTNSGKIINRSDHIDFAGGLVTTIDGSMLGIGQWTGDAFDIDGRVSPGLSPGTMWLDDNASGSGVTLGSNARLRIELGGTTQGTEYDHLIVSNAISLGGALQVRFVDDFQDALSPTATFDIISTNSATGIDGSFVGLPDGFRFDTHDGFGSFTILYLDNVVRLGNFDVYLPGDFDGNGGYGCSDVDALVADIASGDHTPAFDINGDNSVDQTDLDLWLAQAGAVSGFDNPILRGDANLDGVVDGQDFISWNESKFTNTAAWCSGDFSADGVVDGQDFIVWNGNRFTSSNFARNAVAVPEPYSATLLLLALTLAQVSSRPKGRQSQQA